jgi:hypothetical protein
MNMGQLFIRHLCQILLAFALGIFGVTNAWALCSDSLIESAKFSDGAVIPYMLTSDTQKPNYALILMPGGAGQLNPEMQDGKLTFKHVGNFLIRSRNLFCDNSFVVASTNSSESPDRMEGIIKDLNTRYPAAKICIVGTSRSTLSTIALSGPLDGKVSCMVHTASMTTISRLDTSKLKSRHLLVHHKEDGCRQTGYWGAEENHKDYKTPLITMDGGITEGNPCDGFGYHGFNGIEKETVEKIKAWIAQ